MFHSSPALLAAYYYSGTVKQWNSSGSYGFIIDDETKKTLFVPMRELVFLNPNETKRSLWMHQRVQFEKALDQQSRTGRYSTICVNVRDQHGNPLPPGPVVTSALSIFTEKNSGFVVATRQEESRQTQTQKLISEEKAKRLLNRQMILASTTKTETSSSSSQQNGLNNKNNVDPYYSDINNNPLKIRANKALRLIGQKNLVGRVVSIEGAFGFIEGATEQIRNALGGPIFFTKRDIVHANSKTDYLQLKKNSQNNNNNNNIHNLLSASNSGVSNNNNNKNIPGSTYVNVGDQVFFDVAQDVKRAGKVKGVNVRKDMMAVSSSIMLGNTNFGNDALTSFHISSHAAW